jgi:hypothetical protein
MMVTQQEDGIVGVSSATAPRNRDASAATMRASFVGVFGGDACALAVLCDFLHTGREVLCGIAVTCRALRDLTRTLSLRYDGDALSASRLSSLSSLPTRASAACVELSAGDSLSGACKSLARLTGRASLRELHVAQSLRGERDLSAVCQFGALRVLSVRWCSLVSDLSPLALCGALESLTLLGCAAVVSLEPLRACARALPRLRSLAIEGSRQLCSVAGALPAGSLEELALRWCPELASLGGLEACTVLRTLDVRGSAALCSLQPARECAHLRALDIRDCPLITDLSMLSGAELVEVALGGGAESVSRAQLDACADAGLRLSRSVSALESVEITGLGWLRDLSCLRGCSLKALSVSSCSRLTDIAELDAMPSLQRASFRRCSSLENVGPLLSQQQHRAFVLHVSGCATGKGTALKRVRAPKPVDAADAAECQPRPVKRSVGAPIKWPVSARSPRSLPQMLGLEIPSQ